MLSSHIACLSGVWDYDTAQCRAKSVSSEYNKKKKKKRDKSVFPLNKSFHLGHFLRKTFQNRPRTTPGMQRSGHPCVQPTRTPLRHARTSPPAAPRAAGSIRFPLIRFRLIRFPSVRFVPPRSAPRRRAPGARTLTTPPCGRGQTP